MLLFQEKLAEEHKYRRRKRFLPMAKARGIRAMILMMECVRKFYGSALTGGCR